MTNTQEYVITDLLRERVLAGAAYLDEKVPDWRERVEVNTLELSHPCRCVLGQIFTPVIQALPVREAANYLTYEFSEDGDYDGYRYATEEEEWDEDDTHNSDDHTPVRPDEYISPEQCKIYAFDYPYSEGYTFEEMTEAWTRYLKGEL